MAMRQEEVPAALQPVPLPAASQPGGARVLYAHRDQDVGDDEVGLGGAADLGHRAVRVDLGEHESSVVELEDAHLRDDQVDAPDCREGQRAASKDLRLALLRVLHGDDDAFGADDEIHRAAHAGHDLSRDDPVREVARLVDLESAEDGRVHMATPDESEGHRGVDEGAAQLDSCRTAAGVHDVSWFGRVGGPCGDHADLGLEDDAHVGGQVVGDERRQPDAEVHEVPVAQLPCNTAGDELFDLAAVEQYGH